MGAGGGHLGVAVLLRACPSREPRGTMQIRCSVVRTHALPARCRVGLPVAVVRVPHFLRTCGRASRLAATRRQGSSPRHRGHQPSCLGYQMCMRCSCEIKASRSIRMSSFDSACANAGCSVPTSPLTPHRLTRLIKGRTNGSVGFCHSFDCRPLVIDLSPPDKMRSTSVVSEEQPKCEGVGDGSSFSKHPRPYCCMVRYVMKDPEMYP